MVVVAPPFELVPAVPPLAVWDDGSVRIGGTRVQLGHVVDLYNAGVTPEEIVERTPVLTLEAVYGTIAFYLGHRAAIDPWLEERERAGWAILREMDASPEVAALKARARAILAERHVPAH